MLQIYKILYDLSFFCIFLIKLIDAQIDIF